MQSFTYNWSNTTVQAAILQLQSAAAWKEVDEASGGAAGGPSGGGAAGTCGDSSSDLSPEEARRPPLPKIVGIGLTGVFEIIRESRESHPGICKRALQSLLNIVQGLQPEELLRVSQITVSSECMSKEEILFNLAHCLLQNS